ncbi:uncharacterized protein LOC144659516 [Oculina patagonica]
MSTETAPEGTEEEKQLPQCGRVVFRGVELAYLNIDGEYMLPLAELLALVLPSTPRTTLFTRMEKMKVRRHFCEPEEIKLLKTVNGIHGSSANCTLLSKTEVEKYCSMYIDKPSEFNQAISGDANAEHEEQVASEDISSDSARKNKEKNASSQLNNNTIPNKLAVLDKHKKSTPLKPKLRLTKVATAKKVKSRSSSDGQVNKTLTDNASRTAIDGDLTSGNVHKNGEGGVLASSSCSQQVTNFTQTKSLVNLCASKKRVKKRDSSSEPNKKMRKVARGKKRPSDDLEIKEAFESPLKIPKRSELNRHEEGVKMNGTSQFLSSHCNSKKQDCEKLIHSDSSSNDSGFTSTAFSNASTPTKTDFSAGDLSGLLRKDEDTIKEHVRSSPCALKLKTPKKNKPKGDHGKSLTLSPPALLLKRFEDSWLVEQKSPVNEEVTNCLHKRKVKPIKKALATGLAPVFDGVCGPAKPLFQQKQAKKKKKCRKPLSLKEEIGRKSLITKDLIVGESQDGAGIVKKKKFKQKQKGKLLKLKGRKEQTSFNGQVVDSQKGCDFSIAKEKKLERVSQKEPGPKSKPDIDKHSKEELLKKDIILERLVGNALAKFFAPTNSACPSSTDVTPTKVNKPKAKKPKLATATKPVLKTNSNFKLLSLFPATSPLALQDGILSPSFTMSCPKDFQPPSSHPLWNWNLGKPVFRSPQKPLKPKPVQKEALSTPKIVTNKVRKLRRKRKKLSTNKKPLASVSDGVVSSNVTITESKQSVSMANSEFKLPFCGTATNIVMPSTEIEVS